MGGVAVAVGMSVCMCVVGVRVDKEATGLGREGERGVSERGRWNVDAGPATGSEGREQRGES